MLIMAIITSIFENLQLRHEVSTHFFSFEIPKNLLETVELQLFKSNLFE